MENRVNRKEILITKPVKYISDVFAGFFGGITHRELIIFCIFFFVTAISIVGIYFGASSLG
jgi:hypothetical protein